MPSTRLTSSSEKNRQLISMPFCERTSRIHLDVWYAYGHMTSKWKSTEVISGCMAPVHSQRPESASLRVKKCYVEGASADFTRLGS